MVTIEADVLAISRTTLAGMVAGVGVVGVLAAVLPSLRAVRLDLLTAITTDGRSPPPGDEGTTMTSTDAPAPR